MLVFYVLLALVLLAASIYLIILIQEVDRKKLQLKYLYEEIDDFESQIDMVNDTLNSYDRIIRITENVCSRILSVYK